ncbi:MAG: MerR family transcriptional regulator [Acidobacteria bacterium]|nr:MerR family transcriptional regulator [Acidobacteriota bacterium]
MRVEPAVNPEQAKVPDKLYFRIGEVARLVGVEQYVLRYWGKEFPRLAPKQSGRGHRLYRRKDVELALQIKHLLYEKRFTIEGARKHLEGRTKRAPKKAEAPATQAVLFGGPPGDTVDTVRRELDEILKLLR